jgi:hypothetical protein
VYKKCQDKVLMFLVLYVDDILATHWKRCRDIIKLLPNHRNRMIGLSQASYIDMVLAMFTMLDSKKWLLPSRHGFPFTKETCPKTLQEEEQMRVVPFASAIGSFVYAMLYSTRLDICFAVGMVNRYQSNLGPTH